MKNKPYLEWMELIWRGVQVFSKDLETFEQWKPEEKRFYRNYLAMVAEEYGT